jgi:beta-lactamase regulating signal transducer with metallopeptidase domain
MLGGHDASYVRAVWLVASAVGALALVVLGLLFRRARARAELDEAERVLADDDPS